MRHTHLIQAYRPTLRKPQSIVKRSTYYLYMKSAMAMATAVSPESPVAPCLSGAINSSNGPPTKRLKQSLLPFSTTRTNRRAENVVSASESSVGESDIIYNAYRGVLENRPDRVFEIQVDVQTTVGSHEGDAGHISLTTTSSIDTDVR